ncbi:hypothetical protein [Phenylobacterium sp. J367]|uniref:hypothetical protein n=1 Tax=Phenylobacterium sp. J367 TaxID=2898435 RepID=UPI00215138D6|nr:hypothetical protein [Phenylobacterium sp. J367]MCR5878314.1 hypothetical protein [Phenylobacterium sp. J367]
MSEPLNPGTAGGVKGGDGFGGPASRPSGDGLPPASTEGRHIPGSDDSVDTGIGSGDGDIGPDTGGMIGEG